MADTAGELELFRQRWQKEVESRTQASSSSRSAKTPPASQKRSQTLQAKQNVPPNFHPPYRETEEGEDSGEHSYHDLDDKDEARKLGEVGERSHPSTRKEPHSALEHYERAVERETEGSLGDSLNHYRKAFKLDAGVDRIYKNKYFPPSSFKSKPTNPNPSNAPVTVPNPAHHSLEGPHVSSTTELIKSFSSLSIPPAAPPTDASPPPKCPISTIPFEILVTILFQAAITDVASFARLSLVCKRLAYLVATEDKAWKRMCLGPEAGFGAMHYKWMCSISGAPLPMSLNELDANLSSLSLSASPITSDKLCLSPTYPSYKSMFHLRPRIRFNGCYISTVNYIRAGGSTASQATWNSPVHIVTYYRYLRFFRDGSCASLLTTTEPTDVVHYLTKENMHTHHAGGLPSSVMNHALRGRWKLSGNPYQALTSVSDEKDQEEGILHVETEGADAVHPNPKYIYKMMLQLKNAGRGAGTTRNNKLAWMGYWSYNKLTDDWAEFGLKNDKAFLWSRVKSYGAGE